jgi:pectinesterase
MVDCAKEIMKVVFIHIIFCCLCLSGFTQQRIVVDQQGHGDYKTIQEAINSLSDLSSTQRIIFIKNGKYNEKLLIEKNNLLIVGESREKAIITQSISRDEFRCDHADDWGVATVNVNGNDVTLKDLTIVNNYGFEFKAEKTIPCVNDTLNHEKKITKTGHQMALRTMKATRFAAFNCTFSSFGGDTVSPWNVDNGYFYFKNCKIEGGVDLYCPRGWAWAEDCSFNVFNGTAIIWHDGSKHKESISVLNNCYFDGYKNFYLGRFHRDAQMLLMNCKFSKNMRDSAVYHVPSAKETNWGHRIYYKNCEKEGGDFAWHKNDTEIDFQSSIEKLKSWIETVSKNQ